MSWFCVDVEADGPIPGKYSMTEIGAVMITDDWKIGPKFHGKLQPISDKWIPEALAVSGRTREEVMKFPKPVMTMLQFDAWVMKENTEGKPRFIADNAGFDWMMTCWYFHEFCGANPFGFSCLSLTSLWKGIDHNLRANFKKLRKTRHDHNPVNDATGNAEAFIYMVTQHKLYGSHTN